MIIHPAIPISAETYFNNAYFSGTAYFSSTGSVVVPVGNRLKFELFNPEGSGMAFDLVYRRFGNDRQGADPLLQRKVSRVSTALGGTPRPIIKTNPDPRMNHTSVALVTFTADNSETISNSVVGAPMPLNGIPDVLTIFSGIYPGEGLIYEIEGDSGALTDAAVAEIAYGWVERPFEVL